MLAMARGLQTRSEPKLVSITACSCMKTSDLLESQYYRPWKLTKEQESTIKYQIRDAEDQIADELQQFKRDKEHRLREFGALPPSSSDADAMVGEPVERGLSSNTAQDESAATATNHREQSTTPAPVTEDKDQGEMVEAEEDTVIY